MGAGKGHWSVTFRNSVLGWMLVSARKNGGHTLHGRDIPERVRTWALTDAKPTHNGAWRVVDDGALQIIKAASRDGHQATIKTDEIEAPRRRPVVPPGVPAIRNLRDLLRYFSAENATQLNRRIYKGTDCGAWISVRTPDGKWHHNGQDWSSVKAIDAFLIGTIIEGSDAEIQSAPFILPVTKAEVGHYIADMETEADRLWQEANRPGEGARRRHGNAPPSATGRSGRADTLTVFYAPDGIWRLDDVDGTDERPFPAGWYWMHPDYSTGTGPFHSSREAEANARAVLLGTSWAKNGHHIVTMPPAPYSQAVRRRMAAYP